MITDRVCAYYEYYRCEIFHEYLSILKLALNIIIGYFSSFIFWNNKAQEIVQNQLLFIIVL